MPKFKVFKRVNDSQLFFCGERVHSEDGREYFLLDEECQGHVAGNNNLIWPEKPVIPLVAPTPTKTKDIKQSMDDIKPPSE